VSYYRYVVFARIAEYELHGWKLAGQLPRHHGDYAVLMEWIGGGIGP